MKMFCVKDAPGQPVAYFKTARECAVAVLGTEAVVALGFGMFMSVIGGQTVTIEEVENVEV